MAGLQEKEGEFVSQTTTGSVLTYSYKKNADGLTITRKLTPAGGPATVSTTIANIRTDGEQLIRVAQHLEALDKMEV